MSYVMDSGAGGAPSGFEIDLTQDRFEDDEQIPDTERAPSVPAIDATLPEGLPFSVVFFVA
jgi:hypothetical protein